MNSVWIPQRWIWLVTFAAILFLPVFLSPNTSVLNAECILQPEAVTADFDGDQKPDTALSRSWQGYSRIEIQFGTGIRVSLYSPTREATKLVAMDVDRDNDTDLILFAAESQIPAAIWLNNGQGSFATPELWRIEESFPNGTPPPSSGNEEHASLASVVRSFEIAYLPLASIFNGNSACANRVQHFAADDIQRLVPVLLAYGLLTRGPPIV
jgi:hypothetical protein